MEKVSKLSLQWKSRLGGLNRTQRDYLDFVVDDQPLSHKIHRDLISCLGWFLSEENAKAIRRLLLEEAADLPNNRRTLYVCPECGDIGCGAVSLLIEESEDRIIWRDFGYENNYEDFVDTTHYEGFGLFIFNRTEYEQVLKQAV